MRLLLPALALLAACSQNPKTPVPATQPPLIFVGTYTEILGHVEGRATGIYTCSFETNNGTLVVIDSVCDLGNPSFLAISPDRKHLYAVGENGGTAARPFGSVAAYSIGGRGKLQKINEVSCHGIAPCHISTDATGRFVFVANYVTGDVLSFGVRPDGGLTDSICRVKHPGKSPLAHQILAAPNAKIWTVDKGVDALFTFNLAPDGRLVLENKFSVASGAGPRHLDFHPTIPGRFALINELNSTVLVCHKDEKSGAMMVLDRHSTLPAGFSGKNSCAEIQWHPNGRWLYASNRGHNSIAILAADERTGRLSAIGHVPTRGEFPRSFLVMPDGKWLLAANQNSSSVTVFRVDAATGALAAVGEPVRVGTPVCLKVW